MNLIKHLFKSMNVKHRMMIFVGLSILVFALLAIVNKVATSKRERLYIEDETQKRKQNIEAAVATYTHFMKSFVADYTCWDELVSQIYSLSPVWAEENIVSSLKTTSTNYVWLFNNKMESVYSCNSEDVASLAWPIFPKQIYQILDTTVLSLKRITTFFKVYDNKLIEICGATIHLSKDPKRLLAAQGFYLSGHLLDSAYLRKLEILTGAKVSLEISTKKKSDEFGLNKIVLRSYLKAWDKQIIGQLAFTYIDTYRINEKKLNNTYYLLISLLISFLAIAYYFLVANYISSSLNKTVNSLDKNSLTYIKSLLNKKDEFGRIAKMIEHSFEQKISLQEQINERLTAEEELMVQKEELMSQSEELHATTEELSYQVELLQNTNQVIVKQSNSILESIAYASRIQNALLPSESNLKLIFSDFFILYRPRDIVSGDFYYAKISNNRVIVAAADCTGHGVPGAFLSMLGLSFLNEIVLHHSTIHANQILEEMRTYMVSSLSQSTTSHEMQVGMDISVCIIDYNTNTLEFAGAHSPAYIVRVNEDENCYNLIELKADNISISQSRKWKSFGLQTINFEDGDYLYLFSDGIVHQFGGPQNRKFGTNRLKELLVDLNFANENMHEKRIQLEQKFDEWRGVNTQLDDVMVLGLKLMKPDKKDGILYEDSFMGLFDVNEN